VRAAAVVVRVVRYEPARPTPIRLWFVLTGIPPRNASACGAIVEGGGQRAVAAPGGSPHAMAYRPAGLAATPVGALPAGAKAPVAVLWCHPLAAVAVGGGCAMLEAAGAARVECLAESGESRTAT
jgi:hypothetical protein